MNQRLERLRPRLTEASLDALLVSQSENRRYMSGFDGSAGWLLISQDKALLATDFRYVEQATAQAPAFHVMQIRGDLGQWLPGLLDEIKCHRLGFEAADLSFSTHHQLVQTLKEAQKRVRLVPAQGLVESLRAVKDADELPHLEKAAALADAAVEHARQVLQPGISELELAWEIERFLREKGSQSLPFEIIVSSGPNGAMAHHKPGERAIEPGEPVVIDLGDKVNGYCSDLTRTLYIGEPDDKYRRIYDLVLGAQLTAIATMKAGITGEEADRLARTAIEQGGLADAFGHGLGHGIGLAPHELPRLGSSSQDKLLPGMVFTIEPGIYVSGWGGVRIEDMAVLEADGPRLLTHAPKVFD